MDDPIPIFQEFISLFPYFQPFYFPSLTTTILHDISGGLLSWLQPECKFLLMGSQRREVAS